MGPRTRQNNPHAGEKNMLEKEGGLSPPGDLGKSLLARCFGHIMAFGNEERRSGRKIRLGRGVALREVLRRLRDRCALARKSRQTQHRRDGSLTKYFNRKAHGGGTSLTGKEDCDPPKRVHSGGLRSEKEELQ